MNLDKKKVITFVIHPNLSLLADYICNHYQTKRLTIKDLSDYITLHYNNNNQNKKGGLIL